MTYIPTAFFAYASKPADRAESIEDAIQLINKQNVASIQSWKKATPPGSLIIDTVCESINRSDLFMCDLTSLTPNVLFELGYAIAKGKRVWIALNISYPKSREDYKAFHLLSNINFCGYRNSEELASKFLSEQPVHTSSPTIYQRMFLRAASEEVSPFLFYLKSAIPTDASQKLTRRLKTRKFTFPLRIDDPDEVSSQPLNWYIDSLQNAFAVAIHLLDDERARDTGVAPHNSKCSLIAGMAFGLGKRVLMLAHTPFSIPIDYQNLLRTHDTASECLNEANHWLLDIKDQYDNVVKNHREEQRRSSSDQQLQDIYLGEYVAENEVEDIPDYFIETAEYHNMLQAKFYTVYVGRKGTGKTATLYRIAEESQRDKTVHVCIIKPVDYDLSGIIELLERIQSRGEQGYLTQSLWKFLIYTELAQSVTQVVEQRPVHYQKTEAEQSLIDFLRTNAAIIEPDFTARMAEVIEKLCMINFSDAQAKPRTHVSEILHSSVLAKLRDLIGSVLQKKKRVYLLIDNLDKAWGEDTKLKQLSQFLFDLLNVVKTISEEFPKSGFRKESIQLCAIVFLRSDIFAYIKKTAREADKMIYTRPKWDSVLLQRVIEQRFSRYADRLPSGKATWEQFFVPRIADQPTMSYIISRIIPRPRDIIFLCKTALSIAINHHHTRIEEDDILEAEKDYSDYAFKSLLVEARPQISKFENLLYEFVAAPEIVTRAEVDRFIIKAKIPQKKWIAAIELLCDATFLGLEVETDEYEFIYDENKRDIVHQKAKKFARISGMQRYRINVPFHAYLEIRSSALETDKSETDVCIEDGNEGSLPTNDTRRDLSPANNLVTFVESISEINQQEQILVITYYYHVVRKITQLTLEHYYEAYNILQQIDIESPKNLKSSVRNVVDRTTYLQNAERGTYSLTPEGEEYVKSILG